ncbi:hypothetical protein [Amycolatopsis pithecellobii]|uniref:Uncharacterized protein n=1 Tax=Amycolatopsis pithecellobii TaxID=664692 RepID=A0A6N7ZCA6_9PSEU|nr:hypothetical protein [Amycolatopsis pithecellobii]MTD59422.1 hypothetical protein [Amycolatopsis pithecellobii]
MKITTTIGNPGTALSCAASMGAAGRHGTGVRWGKESVLSAGSQTRLVAERRRVFDAGLAPVAVVLPTYEQPKFHVPHPPLERSP